jgi:hypothetical protein
MSKVIVLEAIKEVLKNHFAPLQPRMSLFYSGPNSEDLANELLLEKPPEISFRVICVDTVKKVEVDYPSILLFDSGQRFLERSHKIQWNGRYQEEHKQLVYVSFTYIFKFFYMKHFSKPIVT